MRSDYSPDAAFTLPVRVRSYEAGRNRRVGLGTTLRLLESLATEASSALGFTPDWYVTQGSAWLVREMHILLGELPTIGDELLLGTWLSEWRKVQAYREYAIWRPGGRSPYAATLVARAQARWAYVDRHRGVPLRVPEDMVERFNPLGPSLRHRTVTMPGAGNDAGFGAIHIMRLTARETEADVNQHINNAVYADWLTEALYRACNEQPRFLPADREISPRHYRIEYLRPTLPGDRIRIETACATARSRALDVTQRILDDASGEPVVQAASQHLLLPLPPSANR